MFVGSSGWDDAYELLFSDGKPILDRQVHEPAHAGTTLVTVIDDSPRMPNVLRSKWGIQLAEAVQVIDDNDADLYFLAADPALAEMIKVGFLNGREEPELFIQDMQNVGTFFDKDSITHKVRHIYDTAIADYRPFQVNIPA